MQRLIGGVIGPDGEHKRCAGIGRDNDGRWWGDQAAAVGGGDHGLDEHRGIGLAVPPRRLKLPRVSLYIWSVACEADSLDFERVAPPSLARGGGFVMRPVCSERGAGSARREDRPASSNSVD